jgi:hypothetical protein
VKDLKVDFGDLKRAIEEIKNVELNDSQETKQDPIGDTCAVCYLEE